MRKKPKYRNVKVEVDGIKFDSKREAARYGELKLMERAGVISDLKLQPRYKIEIGGVKVCYESGRQITYVADFEYIDLTRKITRDEIMEHGADWRPTVIEDVKGMRTPVYKIKRALMKAMGLNVKEI